jgi:hypothetical protein
LRRSGPRHLRNVRRALLRLHRLQHHLHHGGGDTNPTMDIPIVSSAPWRSPPPTAQGSSAILKDKFVVGRGRDLDGDHALPGGCQIDPKASSFCLLAAEVDATPNCRLRFFQVT